MEMLLVISCLVSCLSSREEIRLDRFCYRAVVVLDVNQFDSVVWSREGTLFHLIVLLGDGFFEKRPVLVLANLES